MLHRIALILLAFPILSSAAEYRHEGSPGFLFTYDENEWEVIPPRKQKEKADVDQALKERTLVTVQKKTADDKYHARFSVVMEKLGKKFGGSPTEQLLKYRDHAVAFMKNQRFGNFTIDAHTLPGVAHPAVEIIANQRDFGLTFQQIVFIRNGHAFLLTAATRTAKFEAYKSVTKTFFSTFKFIK